MPLAWTRLAQRESAGGVLQRREPDHGLGLVRSAHFLAGLQGATHGWTLRLAKQLAAQIGVQVRAGHASGFAVRQARHGRADGRRGAARAARWLRRRRRTQSSCPCSPGRWERRASRSCPVFCVPFFTPLQKKMQGVWVKQQHAIRWLILHGLLNETHE